MSKDKANTGSAKSGRGRAKVVDKTRPLPKADRDRTLAQFRAALHVRVPNDDETDEGPDWRSEPARGVPPGQLMAARWCTMVDAVHAIGRVLYGRAWASSILDDKPHFPYARAFGLVLRHAVVAHHERASAEPAGERGIAEWAHRPSDRSWGMALGAFAMLYEALSEGLVHAVAESIGGGAVPMGRCDTGPGRYVDARARVAIDADAWRRDGVVMAGGLVRAWWSLGPSPMPAEPPWVVLIDRGTLDGFLARYADVLTVEAATQATEQRGRRRDVPLAEVAAWILPKWRKGTLGPKMGDATAEIQRHFLVPHGTADQWRRDIGIRKGGDQETWGGEGTEPSPGEGETENAARGSDNLDNGH